MSFELTLAERCVAAKTCELIVHLGEETAGAHELFIAGVECVSMRNRGFDSFASFPPHTSNENK